MKSNKLISALPPLRPISIWDARTGEALTANILEEDIDKLVSYVQGEVIRTFDANHQTVIEHATYLKGSANSYGRQLGYKSNAQTLPREVLAKSRINELFLYKLMSETASYARNPNPHKQYPSFPKTINLGAIDKQMATLSKEGTTLTLLWKCWSREYLLEFNIPSYILQRDVKKYSLPVVRFTAHGFEFIYSIQERIPALPNNQKNAGLDLGRVEPYTIAVTNQHGARIAHYTTTGRLKQLNTKREAILTHKKNILAKKHHYAALNLDTKALEIEAKRLANKAKILGHVIAQNMGAEIALKLAKHKLNTLNVENLSWATGSKYGSKWNHSHQQEAIAHALLRNGTRTKKINPKNSSRSCHSCGTLLTNKDRQVRCGECQTILDRDFNAAMNLATQSHLNKCYPSPTNRLTGDNCSSTEQIIGLEDHSSVTKLEPKFSNF